MKGGIDLKVEVEVEVEVEVNAEGEAVKELNEDIF